MWRPLAVAHRLGVPIRPGAGGLPVRTWARSPSP
jgi:hypothetical protein